jgi:transcriptional regulator with XRE-family HTH domain
MIKQKLIDKRKERGFSQERMADLLHLDTSNYSRRENGETKIKIDEWERIAQILAVPISEIFEPEDPSIYNITLTNSTGGQVGDNNAVTGIDPKTVESLNEYIAVLKDQIDALKKENEQLKSKNNP